MSKISIEDKQFEKYILHNEIDKMIKRMANEIYSDFYDKVPVFIPVLNGAFLFAADLIKQFKAPCEVDFIKANSYEEDISTGKVNIISGISIDIKNKHVVLIEDIIDSGLTVEKMLLHLKKYAPKKINIASLLFKKNACEKKIKIDYLGKEISNDFVIGFGLDYNGIGRNFSDIYREIN